MIERCVARRRCDSHRQADRACLFIVAIGLTCTTLTAILAVQLLTRQQ